MSTVEELKKLLKTDDGKKLIQELVDEAKEAVDAKNKELLASLKKEKDSKSELEKRLEALEADKEAAEQKAAEKSGDMNKVKEQLETKFKKELESKDQTIQKLNSQLNTHVVGEGLTQALVKANVAPPLMEAAKALILQKNKGEIGDNDGTPFAKFDGKPVEEFVTQWAQTDAGKHFVSANANNGGGSNGANDSGNAGNAGKKTMPRSEFDALDVQSKAKTMKEGVSFRQSILTLWSKLTWLIH